MEVKAQRRPKFASRQLVDSSSTAPRQLLDSSSTAPRQLLDSSFLHRAREGDPWNKRGRTIEQERENHRAREGEPLFLMCSPPYYDSCFTAPLLLVFLFFFRFCAQSTILRQLLYSSFTARSFIFLCFWCAKHHSTTAPLLLLYPFRGGMSKK